MTDTYEGICRYCGQMQSIIAESQEAADSAVTRNCDCSGSTLAKRDEMIKEAAFQVGSGADVGIIDEIHHLGVMALTGLIDAATLNVDGITFKVAINANGQVRVTKKWTKQSEIQI